MWEKYENQYGLMRGDMVIPSFGTEFLGLGYLSMLIDPTVTTYLAANPLLTHWKLEGGRIEQGMHIGRLPLLQPWVDNQYDLECDAMFGIDFGKSTSRKRGRKPGRSSESGEDPDENWSFHKQIEMNLRLSAQGKHYTPADQTQLALAAQAGDEAARNNLIKSFERFTVSTMVGLMGLRVVATNKSLCQDLFMEGQIELNRQIDSYEPVRDGKAAPFLPHAYTGIRRGILTYLDNHRYTVREPHSWYDYRRNAQRIISKYQQENGGKNPPLEYVASEMELGVETLESALNHEVDSMDAELDDDGFTLALTFVADPDEDPLDNARAMLRHLVDLDDLDERERDIVFHNFMHMKDTEGYMSLKEIADKHGVSQSMISVNKGTLVERLREQILMNATRLGLHQNDILRYLSE